MKTQLSGLSFSLPEFWASFPLNMPMNSPMWEVVGMLDEELRERIDRFRLLGFDPSSEQVKPGIGKAVRETLSAFSHSDGGTLIIGVSETQGFTPVEGFDPQSAQNQLMSRCEQMTPVVRSSVPHSGVTVWWSACCLLWVRSPCDPSRKLSTSDSK